MTGRTAAMLALMLACLAVMTVTAVGLTGGRSNGVLTLPEVAVPAGIPVLLLALFTLLSRR